MSIIEHQTKELREAAHSLDLFPIHDFTYTGKLIRQAADTIEALSSKLSAANMERSEAYYGDGWISCKDRLPDNFEVVLAFAEKRQIVTVARDGEDWVLYDQHIIKEEVIAWQPLPQPYQGE